MGKRKYVNRLVKQRFPLLTKRNQLDSLPDHSIILSEIEECEGTFLLVREGCEWLIAYMYDGGVVEGLDDYTPQLPALLIMATEPSFGDDDE